MSKKIIVLTQTNKEGLCIEKKGKTTAKQTEQGMINITPLIGMDLDGKPPFDQIRLGKKLYSSFVFLEVNNEAFLPSIQKMSFANIEQIGFRDKEIKMIVFSKDSNGLIKNWRVLKLIEQMPKINLSKPSEELIKAEGLIGMGEVYKKSMEILEPWYKITKSIPIAFNQAKIKNEVSTASLGLFGIEFSEVEKIFSCLPEDSFGNIIYPDEKVFVVLPVSDLSDKEFKYLVQNPMEFDILGTVEIISKFDLIHSPLLGKPKVSIVRKNIEEAQEEEYEEYEEYDEQAFLIDRNKVLRSELAFGRNKNEIKEVLCGEVEIFHKGDTDIYYQALQFTANKKHEKSNEEIEETIQIYPIINGDIDFKTEFKGQGFAVGVCAFLEEIVPSNYFESPIGLLSFDGNIKEDSITMEIFIDIFKQTIVETAKEIEKEKGIHVKGVVLGDIEMKQRTENPVMGMVLEAFSNTLELDSPNKIQDVALPVTFVV